jgi:iduronate 2-sulfatase
MGTRQHKPNRLETQAMSQGTRHMFSKTRRHFRSALSLIVLLHFAWATCSRAQSYSSPNVLFLICDDLNCDLSSYGHPLVKSPNIDRLARRGVRFDRAYCQFPLCGPSRASFMTGLYPDQTLVQKNAVYIREHVPNVLTLPQAFRNAGYFAQRIGKIYHYQVPKHIGTSGHDDPYSWNYTINPRGRDKTDESLIFSLTPGSFGGTLSWLAADGDDFEQTDGIAASEAAEALAGFAKSKKPFFLAVGLYRPHTPYVAPKKYFDMYPLEAIRVPEVPVDYHSTLPEPAAKSITNKKQQVNLKIDLARQAIQAYYASISFADAQVGRILRALEETGLSENTIVVFTSDHGYHMGEHGHWQKTTLFENAARVPMIIAGPGVSARGVAAAPAEMLDLYPTLTDLCAVERPSYLSGISLVPMLSDLNAKVRESALTQYGTGYSIRTPQFRYTEWGTAGVHGNELYNHQTDPHEMHNLAMEPQSREQVDELSKLLRARVSDATKPPQTIVQNRTDINRKILEVND